jgi:hypothetical protein
VKFKEKPSFWLIVAGLATWRLTSILHREQIAAPIRKQIGIMPVAEDEDDPEYWIYPDNFIGKVFHCSWCLSVWVAGLNTILLFVFPVLLIPFALSTLVIILYELRDHMYSMEDMYYEDEEEDNGSR